MTMNILSIGDIVGQSGRNAFARYLPVLRQTLKIDATIVNVENSSHGFGVSPQHCRTFFEQGADVLTSGNHIWDRKAIIPYIELEKRLLRPANLSPQSPGKGMVVVTLENGKRLAVANIIGRVSMPPTADNPFACIDQWLKSHRLNLEADAIVIDFHAEATSEKNAMAHFVDGRVSAIFGTHTHIPTADTRILSQGTAYQSDLGMSGDYDSVIGMDKIVSMRRFYHGSRDPFHPAEEAGCLCGLLVQTDSQGKALQAKRIIIGDSLPQDLPPIVASALGK